MSNDDESQSQRRRNSGLMTVPPATQPLPAFGTAEMQAFDLAVALAKVSAAEDGAPPSLLVPNTPVATSPPHHDAPTPVVRVGPSDIARLEQEALTEAAASLPEVPAVPSPVEVTADDAIEFPVGQLAVLERPVRDDQVRNATAPIEDADAIFDAPFADE